MRFVGIDILRAIAIFAVIFHHAIWPQLKPISTQYIFWNGGYMAVSLFFLLSGFIISLPYWQWKRDVSSLRDIKYFYLHRGVRLYPLFIVTGIISILCISWVSLYSTKELFLSLTTVWSFFSTFFFPSINPVYWSLMLEIQMSIVFPFIILFSKQVPLVYFMIVAIIVSYFSQYLWWHIPYDNPHTSPYRDHILWHLDEFIIGMYIARLYIQNKLSVMWGSYYIGIGACILFVWIILADSMRYGTFFWLIWQPDAMLVSFRNIILSIAWICILIPLLSCKNAPKWIIYGWKMCYSLYLWHMILWMLAEQYFWGVSGPISTFIYLSTTILVSSISYMWIEVRLARWLQKYIIKV